MEAQLLTVVLLLMTTAALAGKCDLTSWHRTVFEKYSKQRSLNVTNGGKPCPEDPCPTSPHGPYKNIKFGKIDYVPGLRNGGKPSASIIYPEEAVTGNVSFPILSWGHATFIGTISPGTDTAYIVAMSTVASYGFVIIGADTCPLVECASLFHKDMLQVIKSCAANRTLHPALKNADFTRTGVFGHSMGAMGALVAAGGGIENRTNPADFNIKAAVSMHPCWDPVEKSANVKVPIMFTCGTSDVVCPDGCSKGYYEGVSESLDKVLFDVENASHFEPTGFGDNSEMPAVALFLACHVKGEYCDKVYGDTGREICRQIDGDRIGICHVNHP